MFERISNLLNSPRLNANNWEIGFLGSLKDQVRLRSLSPTQINILEKIENNNTEYIYKEMDRWIAEWSPEQAEITRIVSLYYLSEGSYFMSLIDRILNQNYIPNAKEYAKLCENKYALKIREAHFKEAKFPVNSFVQVRKVCTANKHYRSKNGGHTRLNDALALVLEVNALPVRRAALGAKVYRILPVGSTRTYYVSESDLKMSRKIKK
jgi:hypothetical protein